MKTTFTFRQLISATLLLVAVAFGQNAMAQWYGAGTQDNPYQIRSIADLNALATNVNSGTTYNGTYFVLTTNLTYTYTYAWNSTNGSASENNFVAIGGYGHSFQGHFDGGGHTISGIRIYKDGTTTSDQLQGVFGYLSYGSVRNLTVADASITGYQQVGAIAGCNSTGTIEDCVVASNVGIYHFKDNSSKHGGVVGANTNGNVRRCTSSATIRTNPKFANTVSAICGGIIGYQSQGQAVPHYVEDNIALNVVVQSGQSVGGAIIGKRDSGNINYLHLTNNYYSNCTINGTVNATNVGVGNPAGDMNGARSVHTLTLGTNITAIGESVVIGNTTYYASNTTVTLEYNNLPAGYLISFSYNDGTIHNIDGNTFQMPAANATVSATITPITYNITYDLDGGSVASANPTSYNVETTTFTLNNPTRTGYTFAGWTGTDLTEATQTVTIAQGSMGNRSYTANWTLITYNITYDLDGGSVATANPATYNVTTNTFTLNKPTKTGYTFAGWTGTDLTEATQTVTITQGSIGDRSYTANWAVIPWTGDGFSGSPYLIIYPSQLDLLAKMVNGTDGYTANTFQGKHFKLGNDITYSTTGLGENESNYTAIGNNNSFRGTFDGDGKTISGIRIYTTDNYQGLFGYVYGGTVKNVILANSIITGGDYVGGIVGNNSVAIVTNCRVESSVTINAGESMAFHHGGIAGRNTGTVSGCISAATVSNNGYDNCRYYGGIVGNNVNVGTVKDCLYTGTSVTASLYYGSIVGENSGTLTNNYYTAIELGGVGGNGNATVSADCDGARRARTITLGGDVVLVGDPTAYDVSGLTAIGTTVLNYNDGTTATIYSGNTQNVALNYTGTPPEGYRLAYYTVNNEPVEGNTFEMPAADVVVEAVLLERYYTYNSTTKELALIFGAFNSSNKWGSDVTPSEVTSVTATSDVSFTGDCTNLFTGFSNCTSMDLSNVNTTNVTDMISMFNGCSSLTSLDLSGWNTANVTDMRYMFNGCSSLTAIEGISEWDVSNVTYMPNMFYGCTSLISLDLSGWNTASVEYTSNMFYGCTGLEMLDLSGWNTASVKYTSYMFYGCTGLEMLDLSGWNTANVIEMSHMFQGCTSLTSLDLSGWNTGSVSWMTSMFDGCSSLTLLDLSNLDTGNVIDMSFMFNDCTSLTSLDFSGWNTANVLEMSHMFQGCTSLTSLDLSGWNMRGGVHLNYMFSDCTGLTTLDLSGWDIAEFFGIEMKYMFSGCTSLTTIYVGEGWSTENVEESENMFSGCTSLVGGMGTTYNSQHTDAEYARIDMGPNSDQPGYLTGVFTITLPENVTTTAVATLTHGEVNLYAVGTTITLTYSGEVPEGYVLTYIVNDNAITGDSFEMPAADVTVSVTIDVTPWSGSGIEEDPWIISTSLQLDMLARRVNDNIASGYSSDGFTGKFFKLGNDITYTHITDWNDATSTENNFTAIGKSQNKSFRGTFDGDGYTVSGIRVYKGEDDESSNYQGLFGYVNGGTVKNVTLSDARITGRRSVGGIAGSIRNYDNTQLGIIDNCHVDNTVAIHTVVSNVDGHGGIVGYSAGTISDCTSSAILTVADGLTSCSKYGGIVGYNNGSVSNCFAFGVTVPNVSYMGAIVGSNNYNNGATLTANYYYNCNVGGNTTNVGCEGSDCDGARGVHTLTLGDDISADAIVAVNYNSTDYYTAGTEVTLSYTGEVPEGTRFEYFTMNDEPVEGNTFTMPFGDTEVGVVFLAPYSFVDGVLSLNYGEFNKDNKWGSDVNVSAVTSVTATDEVSFTGDCSSLFASFRNCTSMDLNNVNTEGVTNMVYMFSDCSNLDTLDLSGWNIANVTILNGMFDHCTNLKTLNLTGWDVSHVTYMPVMFRDCRSLTTIEGIKQWNTSNVTIMNSMFRYCKSFKSLDLSGWNTESLTDMGAMFQECDSIQTLNLSGWDVSNITNMNGLFYGCKSLETLDVSGWDVSHVTDMGSIFYNCLSLTTIHRSEWNTENVTYMGAMFYRCSSLETLDLSDWNTENVTNINSMFTYCSNLTTIYVGEGWSTENVTESGGMFFDCTSLVGCRGTTYDAGHTDGDYAHIDGGPDNPGYLSRVRYTFNPETGELVLRFGEFNKDNKWGSDVNVSAVTSVTVTDEVSFTGDCSSLFVGFNNCTSMDLNNVNTDDVTIMACMFYGCPKLETLDLSNWNTANVTAMNGMFNGCTSLKTLNLTGWDVRNVTHMPVLFMHCNSLTTIEGIKQWIPSNVTDMDAMFENCKSLKSLDLSGWNTASLTTMNVMFQACDSLVALNLSGWDVSHVTSLEAVFYSCKSLETLDVSGWDVSNVTNMGIMFNNCSSLKTINRSEWNTENVTNMQAMFYGCSSLETLDLSDWNTENVTNMNSMFVYCSNLTTIYVGEGWNTDNIASGMGVMFYGCTSLVGGMGTTYNVQHTDSDYAHIDGGPDNPGYFSAVPLTPVEYIDADGNTQTRTDYIVLEGSDDLVEYGYSGVEAWYVVNHDVTYNDGVTFNGDVNLILVDGATLNLVNESEYTQSMYCDENLTVYAQSGGTGTIVSNNVLLFVKENLTINGGQISSETNWDAIRADDVVINGGVVTATSQQYGNSIYSHHDVTINGGIVTANATADYYGIKAGGLITLGWTSESDRITVSSYYDEVTIATGKAFSDETDNYYMFDLTDSQIEAIAGQTLSPFNDLDHEFNITYVTNGGTMPDNYPATYTFGETVTLPIPVKEDNTFTGWYDNAEFEGEPVTEIEAGTILGDITLYAKWNAKYTNISYIDENGTEQTVQATILYNSNNSYPGGVYTVTEVVYFGEPLSFSGNTTLILPDIDYYDDGNRTDLLAYGSISVEGNLTIYGQEYGYGTLITSTIATTGNIAIYGGYVFAWESLIANSGNGTITLGWTGLGNELYVGEYQGTVTVVKPLMYMESDIMMVVNIGEVSDNATISGKYLYPYAETLDVSYIDENGETHTVNATVLWGDETNLPGGFYTAMNNGYFDHGLSFSGSTTIILPSVYYGLNIEGDNVSGYGISVSGDLAVYSQIGNLGNLIIWSDDDAIHATGNVTLCNVYSQLGNGIYSGGDILIAGGKFQSGSLNANDGNGTITLGYLEEEDYIRCGGYSGTVKIRDDQKFFYFADGFEPVILTGTLTAEEVAAIAGVTLYPYIEPTVTQTIALSEGVNWISVCVDITLADLENAIVAALPGSAGMKISSQGSGFTQYNGSTWRGGLRVLNLAQMYRIEVPAACELTLTGLPIDSSELPITISNGNNWIAFPLSTSMSVNNAFMGFPAPGDKISSQGNGFTQYNGSTWRGGLRNLDPGKGYIYNSTATGTKTLIFLNGKKK